MLSSQFAQLYDFVSNSQIPREGYEDESEKKKRKKKRNKTTYVKHLQKNSPTEVEIEMSMNILSLLFYLCACAPPHQPYDVSASPFPLVCPPLFFCTHERDFTVLQCQQKNEDVTRRRVPSSRIGKEVCATCWTRTPTSPMPRYSNHMIYSYAIKRLHSCRVNSSVKARLHPSSLVFENLQVQSIVRTLCGVHTLISF